jgi:uncharacterized protein (UPF0264 family)
LYRRALDGLPPRVARVGVAYADWRRARAPHPREVLDVASAAGCRAMLVDTYDKTGGGLLAHWSPDELGEWVEQLRGLRIISVVGGRLSQADLDCVVSCSPDFVAVRGAVCAGSRECALEGNLLRQLVRHLRGLVGRRPAAPESRGTPDEHVCPGTS